MPLQPACALDVTVPSLVASAAVATATITSADGRPFRAVSRYSEPRSQWRLDAGRLRVDDLPPGGWTVSVSTSDGKSFSGTAQTTPAAAASLTLE